MCKSVGDSVILHLYKVNECTLVIKLIIELRPSILLKACTILKIVWTMLTQLVQVVLHTYYKAWQLKLFINRSSQILGLFCTGLVSFALCLLIPIMMDFMNPLNEPRIRLIKYFTIFSHEQIIYIDIFSLCTVFNLTIGFLTTTCTESMLTIISHYLSGLFKIARYGKLLCQLFMNSHSCHMYCM